MADRVRHPMTGPAPMHNSRTSYFPTLAEENGFLLEPPEDLRAIARHGPSCPPGCSRTAEACAQPRTGGLLDYFAAIFFLLQASLATFLCQHPSLLDLATLFKACALCRFAMISLLKR